MMQMAYKNVPNKSNDKISDKQMILKLIENHNLLNPDIVHYIHNYILYDIHDENQSDRYDGLSIQNIIQLLQIKSKDILNENKYYKLINNNIKNEMETYKECLEILNEEINIMNSIFSDQNEVKLHENVLPIIFEITIKSESSIRLYISLLCPLTYPIQSCVISKIYLCGPNTFATKNDIWKLQFTMQKQAQESLGEGHLFEIIQTANDWMNEHDTHYKHGGYIKHLNPYEELRVSLGLMDVRNSKYQKYLGIDRKMFVIDYLHHINSPQAIHSNEKPHIPKKKPTNPKKRYVWLWKDKENNHVEFPPKLSHRINGLEIGYIFSFRIRDYQYTICKETDATALQTNSESGTERQCYRKQSKKFIKNLDANKPQQMHDYMKKNKKISKRDKRNGVKKEIPKLPNVPNVPSKIKYNRFIGSYDYEYDYESDTEINEEFKKTKQKEFNKLKQEKQAEIESAFSVFSPWEIGCTVENLIKKGVIKWDCLYSESKYKLKQCLWKLDGETNNNDNIENQLSLTRHKSYEWMNSDNKNDLNENDIYNITENDLNFNEEETQILMYKLIPFECPICLGLKSMKCGIKLHCYHCVCFVCLSEYIYNNINNGQAFIKCPQYKCDSFLEEYIIQISCDNITYIRYRHFLQNSFMATSKGWKYCPDPKCGAIIKTNINIPLIVCQCNLPLCSLCMTTFHWPLTCKQTKQWKLAKETNFQVKQGEMPKFEIQINVATKDCPKCNSQWEKNGGCNHITCRVCGYQFCWICLGQWKTHGSSYYKCVQSVNKAKDFTRSILAYDDNVSRETWKLWRKKKIKASIQHEHASFFLNNKYLKNEKKLKNLYKNIKKIASDKKKKYEINFVRELICRLVQAHLVISRGCRYVTINNLKNTHVIAQVVESLEVVAYKLDLMFIEKKFISFVDCKWSWYDLMYYMDMFAREAYAHMELKNKIWNISNQT